jgi:hypothetical protein
MTWTPLFLLLTGAGIVAIPLGARRMEQQSWRQSLVALHIRVPHDTRVEQVAQWLARIQVLTESPRWAIIHKPPVAIELVASHQNIAVYVLLPPNLSDSIIASTLAMLPGARVDESPDYLAGRPKPLVAAETKLTSITRPLATERAAETASHLLASLLPLNEHETVIVQWILCGTPRPLPRHVKQSATTTKGNISF